MQPVLVIEWLGHEEIIYLGLINLSAKIIWSQRVLGSERNWFYEFGFAHLSDET